MQDLPVGEAPVAVTIQQVGKPLGQFGACFLSAEYVNVPLSRETEPEVSVVLTAVAFSGSVFVTVASPLFRPASAIASARCSCRSRLNWPSFDVKKSKIPAIEIESTNITTSATTSDCPDSEFGPVVTSYPRLELVMSNCGHAHESRRRCLSYAAVSVCFTIPQSRGGLC